MPARKIDADVCAALQRQASTVTLIPEPAIDMTWLGCLCPADPMPGNRQAIIRYQHLGALTRLVVALDFRAAQGSQTFLRRTNP
jgi:hypothetical protein